MALIWLRNTDTGGVAQFPEESLAAWQAKGWEPCDDPPPDPDPAMVEHVGPSLAHPELSADDAGPDDDSEE